MAHLCYGDKKLSKLICSSVLKTISLSDQSKIEGYLKIVESLTMIEDRDSETRQDLQLKRLEWIFGFPAIDATFSDLEKVKIGIDMPGYDLKKDVYIFKSALTYDPQNNTSLLHLLWRYQGRMDQFTLICLNVLTNIITSSPKIMSFFA